MVFVKLFYREYDLSVPSFLPKCGQFIESENKSVKDEFKTLVVRLEMNGHAGSDSKGSNLACASISSAAISFCEAVAKNQHLHSRAVSSGRGNLIFEIDDVAVEQQEWLAGLTVGFSSALDRVAIEYPEAVEIILLPQD